MSWGCATGHIGPDMPFLSAFCERTQHRHIDPAFPAVTCTAQSDYVTGKPPASTASWAMAGTTGFGRGPVLETTQSTGAGPRCWDTLRERHPDFTFAKVFWWYNMYSSADWSLTPRPMYPPMAARCLIYTPSPPPFERRSSGIWASSLPRVLGPAAGMTTPQGSADCVSCWIAESAKWVEQRNHRRSPPFICRTGL